MKALVVSNCATAAYTTGLRTLFPDWDVKGAEIGAAQKFIEEGNRNFLDHLSQSRLLLAALPDDPMFSGFAPEGLKLFVPAFYFRGYHPDSFHLHHCGEAVGSVLGGGNLHSRIAVTAFLLGMPAKAAVAAFNLRTYERIGYLDVVDSERHDLLARYSGAEIDLAAEFDRWKATGNFLYTYNHPKAFVFNDILVKRLSGHFLATNDTTLARVMLESVPDYLGESAFWPVYPEIAAPLGFPGSLHWRQGRTTDFLTFPLEGFVERTYAILSGLTSLSPQSVPGFEDCAAAIGP
jgi:hypothetical protein